MGTPQTRLPRSARVCKAVSYGMLGPGAPLTGLLLCMLKQPCLQVALKTTAAHVGNVKDVHFILFNNKFFSIFDAEAKQQFEAA